MALHKDLTGADLHESKGVATAGAGTVYVANGAGSGAWTAKNSDNLVFNKFYLQSQMTDISAPSDAVYFYIPVKSEITQLAAVLHAAITGANSVLSIYINGVLFADSLTVNFTGSSAGQSHVQTIVTANTITAGSVIEVRTNGASSTTAKATIHLGLLAKV
jgi:hypothetical protein